MDISPRRVCARVSTHTTDKFVVENGLSLVYLIRNELRPATDVYTSGSNPCLQPQSNYYAGSCAILSPSRRKSNGRSFVHAAACESLRTLSNSLRFSFNAERNCPSVIIEWYNCEGGKIPGTFLKLACQKSWSAHLDNILSRKIQASTRVPRFFFSFFFFSHARVDFVITRWRT